MSPARLNRLAEDKERMDALCRLKTSRFREKLKFSISAESEVEKKLN